MNSLFNILDYYLKFRFMFWTLWIAVTFFYLLFIAIAYQYDKDVQEQEIKNRVDYVLEEMSDFLESSSQDIMYDQKKGQEYWKSFYYVLSSVVRDPQLDAISVYDENGLTLFSTELGLINTYVPSPWLALDVQENEYTRLKLTSRNRIVLLRKMPSVQQNKDAYIAVRYDDRAAFMEYVFFYMSYFVAGYLLTLIVTFFAFFRAGLFMYKHLNVVLDVISFPEPKIQLDDVHENIDQELPVGHFLRTIENVAKDIESSTHEIQKI